MPHILRHNYYLINKQPFSGLKLLSLWLCVRAHLNFPGHILSQATVQLCGNHHLITATKPAASQHPLKFLYGASMETREGWVSAGTEPPSRHTQAHASLRCTVRHFNSWQNCVSIIFLSSGRVVAHSCQDVSVRVNREAWLPHPLAIQTEYYKPVHWLCSISALCTWRGI